ncbi:hypothetical protein RI367_002975 [Sorochytrium milnesiophthora]
MSSPALPGAASSSSTRPASSSPSSSSSSALVSRRGNLALDRYLPPWLVSTLQGLSQWLFWPFVGGIMYGIGEVTAKEVLARRYRKGTAPSVNVVKSEKRQ